LGHDVAGVGRALGNVVLAIQQGGVKGTRERDPDHRRRAQEVPGSTPEVV
jgi:hypothetical protein